MSTAAERTQLNDGSPVRVLFDNSLYYYTSLDDVRVRHRKVMICGQEQTIRLAEVEHRNVAGWRQTDAPTLKAVCDLARAGVVRFCTSDELRWEHWCSSESIRTAHTGTELLRDIDFEDIPSPIGRERLAQVDIATWKSKSMRVKFFQKLRSYGKSGALVNFTHLLGGPCSSFERESLQQLGRFADLCNGLSDTDDKVIDAYHLWTAERSGVPYFLTYDVKFINFMTETSQVKLRSHPILPKDLHKQLLIPSDREPV